MATKTATAEAPVNERFAAEIQSEQEVPKIETDAEHPWALVIVNGLWRMNPGVPAFRTRREAEEYVEKMREVDAAWPAGGVLDYEWRPDLEENPNALKARELLDEANALDMDHETAVETLMAGQLYATLAVRDQLAGFGYEDSAAPAPSSAEHALHPSFNTNPNAQKAHMYLQEVHRLNLDHETKTETLLAAQVYATLAVRDQVAGYNCG